MNELIRAVIVAANAAAAAQSAPPAAAQSAPPAAAQSALPAVVVPPPAVQISAVTTSAVRTSAPNAFADPERDDWLGSDKFRHFAVSFATTSFTFGALSAVVDNDVALAVAVPVSLSAGAGKEIHDRRRGGIFSVRDLVADALGTAAAYFLLREVR